LEQLLGEGGSGVVYLARGPDGVPVAVKVLHRELAEDPGVRTRFAREAYVANTIEHAGAVRILDDGVDEEDVPYLVMELLDGENYEARRIRKGGRLSVDEVLWVADQTLDVLQAAHQKGIVHRDIKPENLFLTGDRKLKVLDFGIARLADHAGTTQAGTILGTLGFMPPEQARGDAAEIGVKSDLWSVGATMFHLLSGHLVREGEDIGKLLREAGSTRVPSLATVVDGVPADLAVLVDSALRLETDVRWVTARVMRRAVRMVHSSIRRSSERSASDEEEQPVSEPSFGAIVTRTIEPPPQSVAVGSEARIVISRLPALPEDLVKEATQATLVAPGNPTADEIVAVRPKRAAVAPPPAAMAPTARPPTVAVVDRLRTKRVALFAVAAVTLAVALLLLMFARG
jgi:serine/threonine-protein kinase